MKKLFTSSALALCGLASFSGQKVGNYAEKSKQAGANFFDIVKENDVIFDRKKTAKRLETRAEKKAWKQYQRWKYNLRNKIDSAGTIPNANLGYYNAGLLGDNGITNIKNARRNNDPTNIFAARQWTNVGPQGLPNANTYTNYPQMGRLNDMFRLNNATNANGHVLFVASPNGGVWKSTDNGATWQPKLDTYASIGVVDVRGASDLTSANYTTRPIYVSTGDFDGSDSKSVGVLKSTDGGETFVATGLAYTSLNNQKTSNLVVINDNTVIVADNNGIKRTTNGGTTWTQVLAAEGNVGRFVRSGNNIIAGNDVGAIYLSTNNGATFTEIIEGGNNADRFAFAADNNGDFYGLNQAGQVKRLNEEEGVYSWSNLGSIPPEYDSQEGYDQTLIVDGDMMIVGGMDAYHSIDQGQTWYKSLNGYWSNNTDSPGRYIHSDHHAMGRLPGTNQYWSANDGGLSFISYAANNRNRPTITYKSARVINTQMYSVAIDPRNNNNNYITGNQDNDSFSQVNNAWYAIATGDGIQSAVNYNNPNIKYTSNQSGMIIRSTTGFVGQLEGNASTTLPNSASIFYFPLEIHKTDPTILYTANKSDVFRLDDNGTDDTIISTALNSGFNAKIESLATHGNVLLAATASAIKKYAVVGNNDNPSWTNINPPNTGITSVDFRQTTPATMYATKGAYTQRAKVYKTINNGTSWTNISDNLPNVAINKVLLMQTRNNETIFVATEFGVYYKTNANTNWFKLGANLPNVDVRDIEINYTTNQLIAATYGRGLWNIDITPPVAPVVLGQEDIEFTQQKFSVAPVPANDELTVYLPTDDLYNYQIINAVGGLVQSGTVSKDSNKIITNNLVNNTYVIRVFNEKTDLTKNIIIKH